jgi:hypothetical protein
MPFQASTKTILYPKPRSCMESLPSIEFSPAPSSTVEEHKGNIEKYHVSSSSTQSSILVCPSATRNSAMLGVIFCIISLFVLDASANCNNDKCLKALNSDLAQASSFCSTYAMNMAVSTPSAINSGYKSSSSKILSA